MDSPGFAAPRSHLAHRVLPLLLALTVFGIGWALDATRRAAEANERETEGRVTAELLGATLSAWLRDRLAIVEHLAEFHSAEGDGDSERFEVEARAIIDSVSGFQALNWVDNEGVISVVVPLETNRPALGRSLRDHPVEHVRQAVTRALDDQMAARTMTIPLYQGGEGIAVYWPAPGGRGVINAVFRTADVMTAAFPPDGAGDRFHLQLQDHDGRIVYANSEWDGRAPAPFEFSADFVDRPLLLRTAARAIGTIGRGPIAAASLIAGSIAAVLCGVLLHLYLRRQRLLHERGRQIQLVMNSTVEGLIGMRLNGACVFSNEAAARQLGYPRAAALQGKHVMSDHLRHDSVDGDGRPEAERILSDIAAGARRTTRDAIMARKDGSAFPVEYTAVPVIEKGAVRGAVLSFVDITEERRLEAEQLSLRRQFEHAQKMESLGMLAGGIAHDFNNILVGILGNASLALEKLELGSPAHALVSAVETATQRAADLTNQLLAYSGGGRFELTPTDLGALVSEMADLLYASIPANVQLNMTRSQALPGVLVDPTQIRQVVMNLITNAADAVAERGHGQVDVMVQALDWHPDMAPRHVFGQRLDAGRYVTVTVEDDGAGMSEKTIARIFDPFFTTKKKGRGLGLSAVLGIVQGHGGMLTVESREGQGTRFMLLLPGSDAPVANARSDPASPEASAFSGTVLLIDDEPLVRDFAEAALATLGLTVLSADDGEAGLALFREHHGDVALVLIDQTMPSLSGSETLQRMREIDPQVNAVLMSGFDEQHVSATLDELGFRAFLQKPFRYLELRAVLEQVLGNDAP